MVDNTPTSDRPTAAMTQPRAAVPKGAWRITVLLLFYMLVNFADKIVVGLAGDPIGRDLHLTNTEFGQLGKWFFIALTIAGVIGGFLANRLSTRWLLLGLATIWGVVQFPMVGTVSFDTLVICRILLGIGEGPAAAIAVHALYKWFPDERRALPTALLSQGSALGVIIAVPALNWVIVNYSWHYAFGALGVVSLMWVVAWLILGKEGPLSSTLDASGKAEPHVPYWKLFSSSTFVGSVLCTFGAYWALVLGLTWFTTFLVRGLHFDQTTAGTITILPWIVGALVVLATGFISQAMSVRGVSTRRCRGVLGAAPLIVGGCLVLMMPYIDNAVARIALLVAGTGLAGSIYVVCPPMIGEFSPIHQRGAMIATYGALYATAGIFAPEVTGRILDSYPLDPLAGYLASFQLLGAILIVSGVIGLLLLRPNADRARLKGSPVASGGLSAAIPAE